MTLSWVQPCCWPCWQRRMGDLNPVRLKPAYRTKERCSFCGGPTSAGIYQRQNPNLVPFPAVKEDDEAPPVRIVLTGEIEPIEGDT